MIQVQSHHPYDFGVLLNSMELQHAKVLLMYQQQIIHASASFFAPEIYLILLSCHLYHLEEYFGCQYVGFLLTLPLLWC